MYTIIKKEKIPPCLDAFFSSRGIHQVRIGERKFICFDSATYRNLLLEDQNWIILSKHLYEELQNYLKEDLSVSESIGQVLYDYSMVQKYIHSDRWNKALSTKNESIIDQELIQFTLKEIYFRDALLRFRALAIRFKNSELMEILLPLGEKISSVFFKFHDSIEFYENHAGLSRCVQELNEIIRTVDKIHSDLLILYRMLMLSNSSLKKVILTSSRFYEILKELHLDPKLIQSNTGIPLQRLLKDPIVLTGFELDLLVALFRRKATKFYSDAILTAEEYFPEIQKADSYGFT